VRLDDEEFNIAVGIGLPAGVGAEEITRAPGAAAARRRAASAIRDSSIIRICPTIVTAVAGWFSALL
jgi:hypothetical protein